MKIGSGHVVEIDYTLRDGAGEVIDTTEGEEPLAYLHGSGQIVPGLERALEGHDAGAHVAVVLPPAEGYGERVAGRTMKVRRTELPEGPTPAVGLELEAVGPRGEHTLFWISALDDDTVTLDSNHPLAGRTLHFDVTVRSVREATRDELEHGHAHGPEGHGHEHHHH